MPDGARNVVETVNQTSKLVMLTELPSQGSLAERTPSVGTLTIKAQPDDPRRSRRCARSTSSATPVERIRHRRARDRGRRHDGLRTRPVLGIPARPQCQDQEKKEALDKVKSVQLAMIAHAERMGDRMAILDAPPNLKPQEVKQWRERDTNFDSKFAALYYPWIRVNGPDGQPIERAALRPHRRHLCAERQRAWRAQGAGQ